LHAAPATGIGEPGGTHQEGHHTSDQNGSTQAMSNHGLAPTIDVLFVVELPPSGNVQIPRVIHFGEYKETKPEKEDSNQAKQLK
jgi:hypothetical protein